VTTITGPALSYPDNVLDLIEPWLGERRPAIVDREDRLSYVDLDELSAGVAAGLVRYGVGVGEPVLVYARLSRWAVVGMLGVLRAGARYVAVDAALPVERQRVLVAASGARVAFVEPGLPVPEGVAAVHSGPGGEMRRGPLAYTCLTSGSTGAPKAVTVSSPALASSTAARLAYYPDPVTGFLLCSSISFDSSVAGIYWTLACGGLLVIPSDRPTDLVAVGRFAVRYRPSHLLMVPSLYAVALGLGDRLGALSTVVVAGEECPPGLVTRHFATLPGASLYNEYGPTECTVWSTVHRCVPADGRAPRVPIGGPIPGTTVHFGPELSVDGPGVTGEPPYRTGDLVSQREDGALLFHGRIDDQLKLGGVRVERAEVEHALGAYPGVTAAAVGVARTGGRVRLVGFVVGAGLDRRALRAHLCDRLPAVAVPARIVPLTRLPTLPTGKVDHGCLDRTAELELGQ
jgi:D-alanine--poly(phosphoribitol) ligase subunit 1